jgi:hypothetical protein
MRLAIVPFLLGAVGASATEPAVEVAEPVAAALLAAVTDGGITGETRTLCVETSAAVDFAVLQSRLAQDGLRPIPISLCSGAQETDPNPLIGPTIRWLDEGGRTAEWLRIARSDCISPRRCTIDVDRQFNGFRYTVERHNGRWSVTAAQSRWIR